MTQTYRNARTGYLTDILTDTTPIGAIVPNLKAGANSYDHSFIKAGAAAFPALSENTGNAYQAGDDPAYTHEGYLYCDGTEYNINDYPGLFEIIGNDYGGTASNGLDILTGGVGYTSNPTVTIDAPSTPGGTTATATATAVNGVVISLTVFEQGSGYTTAPNVVLTGGGASTQATVQARINPNDGSLEGITQNNVLDFLGDTLMGTFKVPNMVAKKVVGNGPVWGQNSPTIANSSMGVGTTGGGWYLDKTLQDNYFSLGRIVTSGYENVVETTECTIIGQQTVEISMRETKLSGAQQHSHTVYHAQAGTNSWIQEASGDRYQQDYREGTGRITRWYPTTGQVFTHSHGLLRQPNTDNTVGTYDVLDYAGGAGGPGTIQDPTVTASEQKYLASGTSGVGTYVFQTFIPSPVFRKFSGSSVIGGRTVNTGGTPIYDYSNEWTYTTPGNYSINLGNITGAPDKLIYEVFAGGGSGAAGTTAGNQGTGSRIKVGDGAEVDLVVGGGGGGQGNVGMGGGTGGIGGSAVNNGSVNVIGGATGAAGQTGANAPTSPGWLYSQYPNDPQGGGNGALATVDPYSSGSNGVNVLVGGQTGTYDQTLDLTIGLYTRNWVAIGTAQLSTGTAGVWSQFMKDHAIYKTFPGLSNPDPYYGDWLECVIEITATGGNSYDVEFASDNEATMHWTGAINDLGTTNNSPAAGTTTSTNVTIGPVDAGLNRVTFRVRNTGSINQNTWSDNPGGLAFEIKDAGTNNVVAESRANCTGGSNTSPTTIFPDTNLIANPTSATFTMWGAKGGRSHRGNYQGSSGGYLQVDLVSGELTTFQSQVWSVEIGRRAGQAIGVSPWQVAQNNVAGASNDYNSGNGGQGGNGHGVNAGGGGGASTLIKRGSLIIAGVGGGGGAGSDGDDGGTGTVGIGPPQGVDATTQALGAGQGGVGGNYTCVGGGGGGGGGGVARNGLTFGGSGNGGGSAGDGGGPGGDGQHQGGAGGRQGISSYRSDYLENASFAETHSRASTDLIQRGEAAVRLQVEYNNDYWTAGGGGGAAGGSFVGNIDFSFLNDPADITVEVGTGGAGVSMGGQTTGSSASAGNGYAKIGLGTITGYEGGQTGTTTGDIIESASQDANVWDVDIFGNGTGTGSAGSFALPTASQVPDVIFAGGGATTNAAGSVTLSGAGTVNAISLDSNGAGYQSQPYVYIMNGVSGGTTATATVDEAAGQVSGLTLTPASSQSYTQYVKFGGLSGNGGTRWINLRPVDTTNCNYFSIKACRGNGVNGGNTPEESLRVYYQLSGSTNWNLIDTIISPISVRNDPIIGNVPLIENTWDGNGTTNWYTYSVAVPEAARATDTRFRLEQPRATPSGANDNADDSDHYGIIEFIWWYSQVSGLVFQQSPGAISKPLVDSLTYTVEGETGPGITYSSGLGASDAKLTLKSTTKIEPQATIDPDIHVPLLHPYRTCKYLIKAY